MIDKRVESMQIGVDEVVRLRREYEEAVRLLRDSYNARNAQLTVTWDEVQAFLAKRKEG